MIKTYSQLAAAIVNNSARKLLDGIERKHTNLALSADLTRSQDLLDLVSQVGPHVCLVKTHIDIVEDFTPKLLAQLKKLASDHRFLILEDRKFADIGSTVQQQYAKGVYRIVEWADFITAHIIAGAGTIEALHQIGAPYDRGVFLLAQMSSQDNLLDPSFSQRALEIAQRHPSFVAGFITQERLFPQGDPSAPSPDFLCLSPGVHLEQRGDLLQQSYRTPHQILANRNSDVVIAGRNIYQARSPSAVAQDLRIAAWEAYLSSS